MGLIFLYFLILQLWYPLSKILAENAAWEFAKEKGLDLVTLLPTYVFGPVLTQTLGATVEVFLNQINGTFFLAIKISYYSGFVKLYMLQVQKGNPYIYFFYSPSAVG